MICKNCQKEMPDVGDFCPFCAEPKEQPVQEEELLTVEETAAEDIPAEEVQDTLPAEDTSEEEMPAEAAPVQEETPKKKLKLWQLIAIIAGGVVLLGVLVCAVLYGLGILRFPANDIYCKEAYVVEQEVAVKHQNRVVATMGDKELTNGELQLYYQNTIYTFYSQYASYIAMLGLDFDQPLALQPCALEEGKTWEQFFLEGALENWLSYTLLEIAAENAGHQVPAELQTELDNMAAQIETYSTQLGYETVEDYLVENLGANVEMEDYIRFNSVYYVSTSYLETFYDVVPTADEVEAYYTANEATFQENGITRDMGLQASVRHILIQPEGGTTDEQGTTTYSDEEWNTALAEAERLLQEWKDGAATEDSFAQLANEHSQDGGSNTNGGLYTDVNADTRFVPEFLNWTIDAARKPGDTEIVKTSHGYHIMYFVSGEDYWNILVGNELIAEQVKTMMDAAREAYPAEIKYKNIYLA